MTILGPKLKKNSAILGISFSFERLLASSRLGINISIFLISLESKYCIPAGLRTVLRLYFLAILAACMSGFIGTSDCIIQYLEVLNKVSHLSISFTFKLSLAPDRIDIVFSPSFLK